MFARLLPPCRSLTRVFVVALLVFFSSGHVAWATTIPLYEVIKIDAPGGNFQFLNESGQVLSMGSDPFIWDEANGVTLLTISESNALKESIFDTPSTNSLGQSVSIINNQEAVLIDPVEGTTFLGFLPGGDRSFGWAINDSTQVVGWGSVPPEPFLGLGTPSNNAFIWESSFGMLNQNDLIDSSDPLFGTFRLQISRDINDMGQILVEGLSAEGPATGFLLTPTDVIPPDPNPSINDTCDVGGGPNDIETVTASYDGDFDEIGVVMDLCDVADNNTKYRVHFDHTAPYFDEADRNGDGIEDPDGLDFCFTTSDDTMMHRGRKDTGPGSIVADSENLTFTVLVDDLNPLIDLGDTVYIWAETQFKGIADRAPNTEAGNGCSQPEVASEVLSLELN